MIKKSRQYFAKNITRLKKLANFKQIKANGTYICSSLLTLLAPEKKAQDISFQEAVKEYNLNEKELNKKANQLGYQAISYLFLGVAIFFYGCFAISKLYFYSFSVCTLLMLMLFSFAFRAHFWRFQIKSKRLGCSYKDWLAAILQGDI